MSEFNVTAPVPRTEARQIPCTSCGVKAGQMCWGNDFEHPARHKAAKQVRFDRWLAAHDRALRDAVLDDLSAGVPDDVKDWVDDYRRPVADTTVIPA